MNISKFIRGWLSSSGMGSGSMFPSSGGIIYLIYDKFLTIRDTGNVNGTSCEPGPGTRTVVDTDSKLWIGNFLAYDLFITARRPVSINGTDSEYGPGTRTVVDTGEKLSIAPLS